MKNIIDILESDHKRILEELSVLETSVSKQPLNLDEIQSFIDFSNDFIEKHHEKEKTILFPKLISVYPDSEKEIKEAILAYKIMRRYVEELEEALQFDNDNEIKKCARFITGSLRDRINKEKATIFSMVDIHLGEEDKRDLMKGLI